MANNSFSTNTNIQFGSSEMKTMWWQAQTFQLPIITLSPPQINSRSGALINLASDTVDYGDLSVDLILDKEWVAYDELYQHFIKRLNVETGNFEQFEQFDVWIEVFDGEGKSVKKFWFYNCRLTSFGDINFSVYDTEDQLNVLNMTFVFDYMDYSGGSFRDQKLKA